jgi:hypothetical protein
VLRMVSKESSSDGKPLMARTISEVSRGLFKLIQLLVILATTTSPTSDTPMSRVDCESADCPSGSTEVLTPVTTNSKPHGA